LLDTHALSKEYINNNFKSFSDFVISAINDDYYLYLYVAKADIPAYYSTNGIHDVMIYGYDADTKKINISDFFKSVFSFEECSFSEMNEAYKNCTDDYINAVVMLKRNNTFQMSINISTVKKLFNDFLNCESTYKLIRELNLHDELCYSYGLNIYNKLFETLMAQHGGIWDLRNTHILYDHKILLLELVKKMHDDGHLSNFELISSKLITMRDKCLLLRNLIIKMHVTNKRNIELIRNKLQTIKSDEQDIYREILVNISDDEIKLNLNKENTACHAEFLLEDRDINGGNWKGKYGSLGYYVVGCKAIFPENVHMRLKNAKFYLRDDKSIDDRAMQVPGQDNQRIAAALYSYTRFMVDFLADKPTKVTIYLYDFERMSRSVNLTICDYIGGSLYTHCITDFCEGIYVSFIISGYIKFVFQPIHEYQSDALISGVFFD
jgi:hypothetical protein